jgi:hypothetical protein
VIAVQQAWAGGSAVGAQRTEGRDHRGNVHCENVDVATHRFVRAQYTGAPRDVDVVFQRFRIGYADGMRDARRRDDIAVAIRGDCLDRRRADVDPDRRLDGDDAILPPEA